MRFTTESSCLFKGSWYLLKVTGYCDSGYTIAEYVGEELGLPVFRDEGTLIEIAAEMIEGWTVAVDTW